MTPDTTPETMKLLSWNVNGRVEAAAERQISAVLRLDPDIVALQEIVATPLASGAGR